MDETRNLPLVQDIILDMTESQLPVVYASQYDTSGRTVNCHMQDEGEDFDCSGYTIELWIKKSNGYSLSDTIVGENAIGSVSGNVVSFPITKKMTYSHGRQECKLVFISENKRTSSCSFYIRVNKATEDNKAVMDSDDYKTFHDEYLNIQRDFSSLTEGINKEIDEINDSLDTKVDSVKIGTTEYKSGTTVTLPVYTTDEVDTTFGADIALTIDTSTYKMNLELKDNKGNVITSKEIDFPIESMVINAGYSNGSLTLTLQNGSTLDVDISSIVGGLVPDTRTIAGVDLKDNITATELRTALNVASGANNYTHPDSGATAGTYRSVTVNAQGHVTAGSNPTLTVAQGGTGATDAATARTNLGVTPANIGAATSGHTHSSYANQNAFSNVKVGSTTVAADTTTDTLELVAGSNVTITPDATNDKITIAATNTVYTHPTYTARTGKPTANQTPAFGGTATVSQITSDTAGHVTGATDRTITIPSTLSNGTGTAGLIKTTSTVTSNSGYTACPVISGVPYYKDTKVTVDTALSSTSTNPVQNKVVNSALANKQDSLGFTPVQQGGGTGQNTNKIYLGWNGSGIKAQVDQTDFGALAFRSELGAYLPLSGGTMTGNIRGNNGGEFAIDGNVFLNTGGYSDWLSNILTNHCYRANSSTFFNSGTPLRINGNAISKDIAQFCCEYNGSCFRIRNDGGATYFMNGNWEGWSNYAYMDTSGNWVFNGGQQLTRDNWVRAAVLNSTYARDTTVSAAVNCYIDTAGTVSRTATNSSRRYKDDITTDLCEELNPHHLYNIDVIQFKYKKDHLTNEKDTRYYKDLIGFIAEDVLEKYKVAADYYIDEETGEEIVEGWNSQYMIPAMLKLIQEQKKEIDLLKEEATEIKSSMN